MNFNGTILDANNFTLKGTAGFKFGGFDVQSGPVILTSTGVAPDRNAPTIPFGGLDFPANFRIDSNGVADFNASKSRNVDWTQFSPGGLATPVWMKVDGTASLSASSSGAITGSIKGTYYWAISFAKPTTGFQTVDLKPVSFSSTGGFTVTPAQPIQGIANFSF